MKKRTKKALLLLALSVGFIVIAAIAVTVTSAVTQNIVHPDYWVLGIPEKVVLSVCLVLYFFVLFKTWRIGPQRTK